MATEQSDGACTPSFSSAELGGDVDLVATLRKFADIAESLWRRSRTSVVLEAGATKKG